MFKKLLPFYLFIFLFQLSKAQNEFITIWKPNMSSVPVVNPLLPLAGQNQIWFPGIGDNYTISWEEVGYPQHTGVLTNVTSTDRVLIDFGTPLNPSLPNATFKVKASNGNGIFKQIKFANTTVTSSVIIDYIGIQTLGSADKIVEIAQWGNIHWQSMNSAFAQCMYLQLTATDTPDLSGVQDASIMFHNAYNFAGNPSMATWNTSNIQNFKYMFGYLSSPLGYTLNDTFNPPIGNWNMSSAQDISYMFMRRKMFNQNVNSWNTSNVTNMSYTFAECMAFNQPLNNWNTSSVTNMTFMLHYLPNFNQPLDQWDTSNVTNMSHLFHGCAAFNQPINSWDTSKVTDTNTMFSSAASFDQTLQDWDLNALISANNMFLNSGLKCANYSYTLAGWADNPVTANNIDLGYLVPLKYSTGVTSKRNILLGKGWTIAGDLAVECEILGLHDTHLANNNAEIYPNPAENIIHLKNIFNAKNYVISDASGRIIVKDVLSSDFISVQNLTPGNYILSITTRDKIHTFKFIKK
ncbi:BspA family leucine-rich repeat surface protein [Chryseobacterium gwangjuense]|uniref:BspA family leucine-rich repeat surface protein n=1 Tax=Chryseobacterium gwangjuense TaxID=1069980 RepID=UPI001E5800D9|nr:BspA family leucine-rich repeat surface protein [Chryseobacterium gwangjuense]MCE3076368.1 BspA family leucine-rich repeat surface protein [Chryseobacterium gwangjuense]